MRELFGDRCVRITLEEETGVFCFERTEEPYATSAEFLALHAQIGRVLDQVGRDRRHLLVDMRRAPLNNDPEFERVAERGRAILVRGFRRVAVLVRTAVGALQVKRHVREDGRDFLVTTESWRAYEFLLEDSKIEGSPPSGVAPTPSRRRTTDAAAERSTPPPPPARPEPPLNDGPFANLAKLAGRR